MAEPQKFTFDTEFRPEGDLISNAARARQKRVFTQAEIDQMFAKARAEGMKAGQVRAAEATATAIAQLCATVHESMDTALGQIDALREEAAQLALIAARKLAKRAVEEFPQDEVEDALREAIHQAIAEPRIVLRAAPNVIALLKDKIEELAHEQGYEGRIVATADPTIRGGDCRVEWRGGGTERSIEHLEDAIREVIERRFSQIRTSRKG
jgi:flagellar assembly protein FliH